MKNIFYYTLTFLLLLVVSHTHAQIITTFAGGGTGGDGGPAVDCELYLPYGMAIDAAGNVYIADEYGYRVHKVDIAGIITTFAGTGVPGYSGDDSAATAAMLSHPVSVAVDAITGNVYISDFENSRIRMVNTAGTITTVVGTGTIGYNGDNIPATAAELSGPAGIAIDGSGNLYICDPNNNRIRMVNTSGIITTIAGTGVPGLVSDGESATATTINEPYGIAVDATGNIFFTDNVAHVFKINTSSIISTVAGSLGSGYNGDNIPATTAQLYGPNGVAVAGDGNIYIADYFNYRVRRVNASGIITTYAGNGSIGDSGDDGPATHAELDGPIGVMVDNSGNLYISTNKYVRYIMNTVSVPGIINPALGINLYPNPCNGDFTINISSAINEKAQIVITDEIGKKIKNVSINTNKPLRLKLDERSRLYFISATTTHGTSFEKLVIAP